jgi:hypothetical protein
MAWIYFLWFLLPSLLLSMVRIALRPIILGGIQRTIAFVGISFLVFVYYYAES